MGMPPAFFVHRRVRYRALGALVIATLVVAGAWSGCTVTESNYKTLSRFFDGVPDPTAVGLDGGPGQANVPSLSVHEPYAKERCDECHNTGVRLSRESSSLCLKCHEKVPGEHPRMHGPVAAVACLWCHTPHESVQKHLMRDTDRKVCSQCHTPSLLEAVRVPAHADEARGCLECHSGHGGTAPYQLKPGVAAGASAPAEK